MAVNKQVLNAQTNKPTFGLVQDALTGSYLMTRKDIFLNREEVMQLMMAAEKTMQIYNSNWTLPTPAVWKPKQLWTGKQVYSMLLPPIYLSKVVRNGSADPMDCNEKWVHIVKGQLLCGALCKQTMGTTTGGVVHVIAKDMGMDRAALFLSDIQRMVNSWLLDVGFSVGISDCVANDQIKDGTRAILEHAYKRIEYINQNGNDLTKREIEEPVSDILGDIINQTGRLAQSQMSDENRIYVMSTAGSKGNPINISQIMTCVGQQTVNGQRIHVRNTLDQDDAGSRTLTCFTQDDENPEVHGFCPNSFGTGLEPEEMYMHAMGGREGLVDTAVKTSVTGYIQRRLLKAGEALQVKFDGTVRNAENYIVDFTYGCDGMDAQYLEPCYLDIVTMSNEDLDSRFRVNDPQFANEIELHLRDLHYLRDQCRKAKQNLWTQEVESAVLVPCHIPRLLQQILGQGGQCYQGKEQEKETPVNPKLWHKMVQGFFKSIARTRSTGKGWLFLETLMKSVLSIKTVCYNGWGGANKVSERKGALTVSIFQTLLNQCEKLYHTSQAQYGEMVGALASESLGFHYSGVGNKNVSRGVPRLRELIDVTKSDKIKTPSMTIMLKPQYAHNKEAANYLAETLAHTVLSDVIQNYETIWEPDPLETTVPEDREMLRVANIFRNHALLQTASRWIIRVVLDRSRCLQRDLFPQDVANSIRDYIGDRGDVVYSATNSVKWVIRLALFNIREMAQHIQSKSSQWKQIQEEKILTQTEMDRLLHNIALGGIYGVSQPCLREINTAYIDEKTGAIVKDREFIIDTRGTSLLEAWAVDGVDWTRTVSNDLYEVYDTLGIEAVVLVLFQEIKAVLADSYVNDRHIMSVVRTMCFRGYLMPNTRHGINRIDTGVFMKVSFEESMDHLTNAALFAEKDELKGVTENMMVGALAPMGTAMVKCEVKPEYKSLMDKVCYNRLKVEEEQQKIFRSMITEWNDQYDVQQDDMDDIDRPPSPPIADHFIAENQYQQRHQHFIGDVNLEYRPSSPNMDYGTMDVDEELSNKQNVYRPSSPDLEAIGSSNVVATFIPLHEFPVETDLFLPPPLLFSLLPDEPATETVTSEPLVAIVSERNKRTDGVGEDLNSLLNNLSDYFK